MTPEDPTVHVEAPLSPAEDESEPIRRHPLKQQPIPRDEDHTPPGFAPVKFKPKCVDRAGFARPEHDYSHDSPQGPRCIWCGQLQHMSPL